MDPITENPKEDPITEYIKEDLITEDPERTLLLWILKRTLPLRTIKKILSLKTIKKTLSQRILKRTPSLRKGTKDEPITEYPQELRDSHNDTWKKLFLAFWKWYMRELAMGINFQINIFVLEGLNILYLVQETFLHQNIEIF